MLLFIETKTSRKGVGLLGGNVKVNLMVPCAVLRHCWKRVRLSCVLFQMKKNDGRV